MKNYFLESHRDITVNLVVITNWAGDYKYSIRTIIRGKEYVLNMEGEPVSIGGNHYPIMDGISPEKVKGVLDKFKNNIFNNKNNILDKSYSK